MDGSLHTQKDHYRIGLNYWPIDTGIYWWRSFDQGSVEEDFSRIREAGVETLRIFLLWEDFQPEPQKVSIQSIDRLVTVIEMGYEKGLRFVVTFFTGHMSGVNFLPPWMIEPDNGEFRFSIFSEGRKRKGKVLNFYSDREIQKAQKLLLREVSEALKGHPALWAWDLGNEPSNLVLPNSKEEAERWLEEMVSELKKRGESILVTLGLHQEDLEEDRRMGPKEVAHWCDFLSIHAYSIYAPWTSDKMDESVIPFLGLLTWWLGSKEVLIEEVGIPSSNTFKGEMIVSEKEAYSYYERLLHSLSRYPFMGVFFWCYGDYSRALWERPPLDGAIHERCFGVFREDRSPKPFLPLLSLLQEKKRGEEMRLDWIGIEPDEYFLNPKEHLSKLFWRFKEQED
jgi:endo-1,4-beta-mannosidase